MAPIKVDLPYADYMDFLVMHGDFFCLGQQNFFDLGQNRFCPGRLTGQKYLFKDVLLEIYLILTNSILNSMVVTRYASVSILEFGVVQKLHGQNFGLF